jgi:hypothetical protein
MIDYIKENQNRALRRKFIIENLQEFGESWDVCENQCVEVIWCCGYKVLDFDSEILDLDSVPVLLIKFFDKVKISQMWGMPGSLWLLSMLHFRDPLPAFITMQIGTG